MHEVTVIVQWWFRGKWNESNPLPQLLVIKTVSHVTVLRYRLGRKDNFLWKRKNLPLSLRADTASVFYKVLDTLLRSCWLTRAWTCLHIHTHKNTHGYKHIGATSLTRCSLILPHVYVSACAGVSFLHHHASCQPQTDQIVSVCLVDCTGIHSQGNHFTMSGYILQKSTLMPNLLYNHVN